VSVERRPFCADVSSANDEPLAATASRIEHWLLVEYRGAWSRDVLGGSLLADEVKAHLREQLATLPHPRLLFVRKPDRRAHATRHVFVARSTPGEERLLRLTIEELHDLVALDLAAVLAGDAPAARPDEPVFVVCTHGKRDRCCARYGRPLYDALREEAQPERVWQSTHVGGDRFAGNVVVLPHGIYYGRVGPADTTAVLAAQAAGELDLERYRGRSTFSFAVQAAERAIRESQKLRGIDDLAFLGSLRAGEGTTRVRFRTPDGATHELDVVARRVADPVYLTCETAEPKRPLRHEVTAHRVVSP
jgi:hypothetical protein